jgi:hypothetical protein
MIMQLLFRQAITLESGAQTGVGSGKTIFPDLIEHGGGLGIGSAVIAFESDFIADDSLIDEVIGSLFARRDAEIERLIVQELHQPQLVPDITELNGVPADNDSDTVEDDGCGKTCREGDQEHPNLRHQNVCPIEKKNWK